MTRLRWYSLWRTRSGLKLLLGRKGEGTLVAQFRAKNYREAKRRADGRYGVQVGQAID